MIKKIYILLELFYTYLHIFIYKIIYINQVSFYGITKLSFGFHLKIYGRKSKFISSNLKTRENVSIRVENGFLQIGNNCFINQGCSINCLKKIIIGENTLLGENVQLYDHNHQYRNLKQPIYTQGFTYGKINIGNNCWIGSNVVILKNVHIGDNVIIGAGCIIHKDIPSNTIIYNKQNLITQEIQNENCSCG